MPDIPSVNNACVPGAKRTGQNQQLLGLEKILKVCLPSEGKNLLQVLLQKVTTGSFPQLLHSLHANQQIVRKILLPYLIDPKLEFETAKLIKALLATPEGTKLAGNIFKDVFNKDRGLAGRLLGHFNAADVCRLAYNSKTPLGMFLPYLTASAKNDPEIEARFALADRIEQTESFLENNFRFEHISTIELDSIKDQILFLLSNYFDSAKTKNDLELLVYKINNLPHRVAFYSSEPLKLENLHFVFNGKRQEQQVKAQIMRDISPPLRIVKAELVSLLKEEAF